jgi:general secretion pathway protein A
MYLKYYDLEAEPFNVTPDPDFLYLSPSHREAFASLVYAVENRKGFVALTGEVGTGKTTVLRAYMRHIKKKPIRAVYLFNSNVSFDHLLETLLHELGVKVKNKTGAWMLPWLQWFLVQLFQKGFNVVLVVDEAQNMPVDTLEKLRVLSNLETTKDKLLQIILAGQPELDEKLNRYELRQLNQRISLRVGIRPLTSEQSRAYIQHRLQQVGGVPNEVFAPAAINAIVKHAQGIPRVLNTIASNAIITGAGYRQKPIGARVVGEVVSDLKIGASRKFLRWASAAGIAAAAAVCVFAGFLLWWHPVSADAGSSVNRESGADAEVTGTPTPLLMPPEGTTGAGDSAALEPAKQASEVLPTMAGAHAGSGADAGEGKTP